MTFLLIKYLHILGAIVLLGTGIGIAFFMLMAHRSADVGHIARTASSVVFGDFLFTATAVILQPVTGFLLLSEAGLSMREGWIIASLILYGVAGGFWLPVVWMQMRMRDLALEASASKRPLPDSYHRLFRLWFVFGVPGFGAVIAILWLMVAKPSF